MSVRVSPYLLSLIDWTDPYRDPLRLQFIPIASRLFPDHPLLDLDSLHERKDMPVPGLTHRYPDKALFLALDICPVYCRFCTRSYAVGIDTEEVAKFHLRVNQERWAGDVRVHRLAPRAGGHRDLRRRRLSAAGRADHADRRSLAGHPARAPLPLRHQGPGGHAAEAADRSRLDRCADPRGGKGPQAAQRGGAAHPLQPPARDHRHDQSGAGPSVRARHHRAQPDRAAARGQRQLRAPGAAGQAARLRQRAPLLHLHARPGQRRRGPAHDAADGAGDRKGRARSDLRLQHAPGRGRRARRRWQTRRAFLRALQPDDRHLGLHQSGGAPWSRSTSTSTPSICCPTRASAAGPIPAQHQPMLDEAKAAALAGQR